MDLILGLHSRILQQLLLLTLREHGEILIFRTFFGVPRTWVRCLLPFAVLNPNSSIGMILYRETTFCHFLVSSLLYTLHEVGVGFV